MRIALIAASLTILLAGCAQPSDQGQQQSASPTPSASAPSPAPTPTAAVAQELPASPSVGSLPAVTPLPASIAPAATLAPGATVMPAPSATAQQVVSLPPNAPPQIVDLHLDKTVVQSGDTVSGTVRTSSNVASVEARIANFSISVPKTGEGRFALSYTVPNLPFFLKKTYDMVVIARNTAGVQTQRVVPITIR